MFNDRKETEILAPPSPRSKKELKRGRVTKSWAAKEEREVVCRTGWNLNHAQPLVCQRRVHSTQDREVGNHRARGHCTHRRGRGGLRRRVTCFWFLLARKEGFGLELGGLDSVARWPRGIWPVSPAGLRRKSGNVRQSSHCLFPEASHCRSLGLYGLSVQVLPSSQGRHVT